MSDLAYIEAKLSDLIDRGIGSIGQAIVRQQGEFALAGANNSSQSRMHAEQMLKNGFREELEKAARLTIDVGANQEPEALEELKNQASRLGESLLERHKNRLFGSRGFDKDVEAKWAEGKARVGSELSAISNLVLEDVKRGIVGHSKYEAVPPEPSVEIKASGSNVVVGSPNANVQQGRDNLTQNVTDWDPSELLAILTDVRKREREIDAYIEDSEALKLQVAALEALATSKSKDSGMIGQGINYIARTLLTAADGRFQSIVNRLFEVQPPLS